jgi:hypothetical protein
MNSVSPPTIGDVVGEVGFALRLSPKLKAKIERWARAQHRSTNSQMVAALEVAVAQAERRGEIPPENKDEEEKGS